MKHVLNKIRNVINKKEREEIDYWKKEYEKVCDEFNKCTSIILGNRIAIHNTVDELIEIDLLSEKERRTFYDILDNKNNYVRDYYYLIFHQENEGS